MSLNLAFKPSSLFDPTPKVDVPEVLSHDIRILRNPLGWTPEIAQSALLGKSRRLSAILGADHPFEDVGKPHGSHIAAFNSLIGRLGLGEINPIHGQLKSDKLEGSGVIVGGPVASLHARRILGTGGISPLLGVQLQVKFDLSRFEQAIEQRQESWQIVVDGIASTREHILITSLPVGDERIINIASLTPAGNYATDLILKDRGLLEKLYHATRAMIAWQAIFEVLASENVPHTIGEFKVFEIANVNFDEIESTLHDRLFSLDLVEGGLARPPLANRKSRTEIGESRGIFSGVSWATAAPELKTNLPPPPTREEFDSSESFEEAKSGWIHRVMPILALRHAKRQRSLSQR